MTGTTTHVTQLIDWYLYAHSDNERVPARRHHSGVIHLVGENEFGERVFFVGAMPYSRLLMLELRIREWLTVEEHYLEQAVPAGDGLMDSKQVGHTLTDRTLRRNIETGSDATINVTEEGDDFRLTCADLRGDATFWVCKLSRSTLLEIGSCIRLWLAAGVHYERDPLSQ